MADNNSTAPCDERKFCYHYPHPAVTTDCVIFTARNGQLLLLLVKRGLEPYKGKWALPGGFMRIDETAEECARRELFEETGLSTAYVRQYHAFTDVKRDPRERVVTIAYYALVRYADVVGGDDADDARWFGVDMLPELAFDHALIVAKALETMRRDIYFDPIGFELLPNEFSMSELQKLFEVITGTNFDRRNFYNKMRSTGFVNEAPPMMTERTRRDDIPFFKPMDLDGGHRDGYRRYGMKSALPRAHSRCNDEDSAVPLMCEPDECAPAETKKSTRRSKIRYMFSRAGWEKIKKSKGGSPFSI